MNDVATAAVAPQTRLYHKQPYHRRGRPRHKSTDLSRRNPGTMWHRIQENLHDLIRSGLDPNMGTVIGRLFIFEVITERQVASALLYAEISGKYSRYHAEGRRHAVSPAFQRGFRAYDNEIQQHAENDTIKTYERRARKAKKAWYKLQTCIPNSDSRKMVEQVCLDNQMIPSMYYPDLKTLLDNIGRSFFGAT